MYSYNPYYGKWLAHHGVKGMKWGRRKRVNQYKDYLKKRKAEERTSAYGKHQTSTRLMGKGVSNDLHKSEIDRTMTKKHGYSKEQISSYENKRTNRRKAGIAAGAVLLGSSGGLRAGKGLHMLTHLNDYDEAYKRRKW